MSAPKEPGMDEMTLDTAAELAENYRTKIAMPFEKLAEVLRVAKDSKNLVATYARQVPELEGRLEALKIEEGGAIARVANATARALDADKDAARAVQAAEDRAATAQANATRAISASESEAVAKVATLNAAYTARKADLDTALEIAQQRLTGLQAEYEALVASFKAKFG